MIEIEDAGPPTHFSGASRPPSSRSFPPPRSQTLCDESARIFKELTGYDRVMVYRFDEAGHGEVFSETKKPELEAFLGNRYPASDIPQIARRLYERNRVRLLADVNYTPAALSPRLSPISGQELDMSLCFLRSVSPIHLQYLKNMGVAATLVVSLMVGGRLWGLVSCHHYSPRFLHFELRSVCELLAEVIGTRIAALESFVERPGRTRRAPARTANDRMDLARRRLARRAVRPLAPPAAAARSERRGADLRGRDHDDRRCSRDRRRFARSRVGSARNSSDGVFSTASLGERGAGLRRACGGRQRRSWPRRISAQADEMLIWFRNERVRTVTWGGNPFKSPSSEDDPSELSPRRSFAQWHQIVKGTSDPWTAADLAPRG